MSKSSPKAISALQMSILRTLWRFGPVSAGGIHQRLNGKARRATIYQALYRMRDRCLVTFDKPDGKRGLYTAAVGPVDVMKSQAEEFVVRMLGINNEVQSVGVFEELRPRLGDIPIDCMGDVMALGRPMNGTVCLKIMTVVHEGKES